MKKCCITIILLLCTLLLVGCGSDAREYSREPSSNAESSEDNIVSDRSIYIEIEDVCSRYEPFQKNLYTDLRTGYEYDIISHSPDSEDHTDTVYAEITYNFNFCSETFGFNMIFQYSKSDDIWTCISSEEPRIVDVSFDEDLLTGWVLSESENRYEHTWTWNIEIISLDTKSETITVSYDITNYYGDDSINWSNTETLPINIRDDKPLKSKMDFYVPCGYYIGDDYYDYYIHVEVEYRDIFDHAVIYNGYEYK